MGWDLLAGGVGSVGVGWVDPVGWIGFIWADLTRVGSGLARDPVRDGIRASTGWDPARITCELFCLNPTPRRMSPAKSLPSSSSSAAAATLDIAPADAAETLVPSAYGRG